MLLVTACAVGCSGAVSTAPSEGSSQPGVPYEDPAAFRGGAPRKTERPAPQPAPVVAARQKRRVQGVTAQSAAGVPTIGPAEWLDGSANPCVRDKQGFVRAMTALDRLLPEAIDGVAIQTPRHDDEVIATTYGTYKCAQRRAGVSYRLLVDPQNAVLLTRAHREEAARGSFELSDLTLQGFKGEVLFDKSKNSNAFLYLDDVVVVIALVEPTDDRQAAVAILQSLDLAAVKRAVCGK